MNQLFPIFGLFLYFPEDKTEYIPAAITMIIFTLAAFFAFRFILKLSKKEQDQVEKLMNQTKPDHDKD
jgi:preprotein translocase subunit YajC